jgi:HAD superfamily hydrolase (TIGR01509 family)
MKKLIIFDLDGVLIDAKMIHYDALNEALKLFDKKYCITMQEHLSIYDGLKTHSKLDLLSQNKNLPIKYHEQVWKEKQKITKLKFQQINPDNRLIEIFRELNTLGFKIACCSNSIRPTVYTALAKLGIMEFFDIVVSNEDVKNSKPHPEMYWKAMSTLNIFPHETLIVEDSPIGLLGAEQSGAQVCRVKNCNDLTLEKILSFSKINKDMNIKWQDNNLNVLIPMAGSGSRFEKAGYSFPKPLIDIRGCPMIQVVINNLNFESPHIFIVQKEHRNKYNLDSLLSLIVKNHTIVETDTLTQGAACTTLLAENYINNDNPLIIANSDQFIKWNTSEFMYKMQEQNLDGGILTFKSTHPKWSFAKTDNFGFVTEVAEKNPISDIATVGVYYWKRGSDYVKYAKQMIAKNKTYNNEFYVCPVFNEAIEDGKKIKTYNVEEMHGLGTPEDLEIFLKHDINIS